MIIDILPVFVTNINYWCSLEPLQRGGYNVYRQSTFAPMFTPANTIFPL